MKIHQVVSNPIPDSALSKELAIVGLMRSNLDKWNFFLSVACSPHSIFFSKEVRRCAEMSEENVKYITANDASRKIGLVCMWL